MWTGKPVRCAHTCSLSRQHYVPSKEWDARRAMVAKVAIDVSSGANAIVHALVGAHAADPAVNGSCAACRACRELIC